MSETLVLGAPRSGAMNRLAVAAVCLIGALVAASSAEALDPERHVTQYAHTSWRTQDGSAPAGMFSIAQTSDGFLWVLSLAGDVYRFDGVRFIRWPVPPDPSGKVFGDSAGRLWVVSDAFVRLEGKAVAARVPLTGLHGFQSISREADGTLWVGLRGRDEPLCNVSERGVTCFGQRSGIPLTDVNAIASDGQGGLWVGGQTALVHWRRTGGSETYAVKSAVSSLASTPDGTLWVGLMEEGPGLGLHRLRDGVLKPFVTPQFDGTQIGVTSLLVDRDGNLWVASDASGVVRIAAGGVARYRQTDGLSGDSVWALFEDREGIVWAGTTSGLDSFRDSPAVTFSATQGLGKDLAAGIQASRDGTVWVANNGSLDRIRNGHVTSIRRRDGLPGEQVTAMLEDSAGNMWVGVDDALYLFKDGRFRRLPEPDSQPLGMVFGLAEDVDGNIWASCGGKSRKLVRIRDFKVREVFPGSQVPSGSHLAADPHGGIWIATSKGDVVLLRHGRIETTVPLGPRTSTLNRHVVAGADGSVLVGSENGLAGWRAGHVQRMTTENGLPCEFVIAFVQDTTKRWWLYTRCGIVSFADAELQKWWANPDAAIQARVYDAFDGAQPNIGSFNAAAATSDGRVWFASGVVVQMLNPSRIAEPAAAATPFVDSVIVDRNDIATVDHLEIGPRPRELQIDYTSPTFSIPQKVTFRYRLDPYDDRWHEAGPRRQAFYTDLRPGTYTFRVMAANNRGVWNERAATLTFSVTPAYYQTTWFSTASAVLFVALFWSAYLWRVRQLRRAFQRTLDARVSERMRIARELHDTLLQSFQGALLRFQAVANAMAARPVEARERLERALDQAEAALTEGRDAVQGLRASAVTVNDLANGIAAVGADLTSDPSLVNPPEVAVEVDGASRDLNPVVREEAYRIATEALRNAVKHAQASRIAVTIHYEPRQLRLTVRDDGRGMDADAIHSHQREGHFGMPGMRERAAIVNGRLEVLSEPGAGTHIELRVPASIAYGRSGVSRWRRFRR